MDFKKHFENRFFAAWFIITICSFVATLVLAWNGCRFVGCMIVCLLSLIASVEIWTADEDYYASKNKGGEKNDN